MNRFYLRCDKGIFHFKTSYPFDTSLNPDYVLELCDEP